MAAQRVQRRKPQKLTKKHIFTDDKIQEIRDAFHMFDKNGDGMITRDELGSVMVSLGQRPSNYELQGFIRAVDTDKSGTIDFDEFVDIFARKVTIDPEAELRQVFMAFDKNNDGFISSEELFNVLTKLGDKITMHKATEMIKEADLNGDGKVDYSDNNILSEGQSGCNFGLFLDSKYTLSSRQYSGPRDPDVMKKNLFNHLVSNVILTTGWALTITMESCDENDNLCQFPPAINLCC